jgi:hypothetical protein
MIDETRGGNNAGQLDHDPIDDVTAADAQHIR